MKCSEAITKLSLLAGGDLPEPEIAEVRAHLEDCESCASEFKAYQESGRVIRRIADIDKPEVLPDDFASKVVKSALSDATSPVQSAGGDRVTRFRPSLVLASLAAVLVLAFGLSYMAWHDDVRLPGDNRSVVEWDSLKDRFEGLDESPSKLATWEPTGEAGVFAVMHKPDPENNPDLYTIDYCGQARRMVSYRRYPWASQRARRLLSRAGTEENVYIAVIPMPGSNPRDRKEMEERFIREFAPFFNRKQGA